jgi:hypothetical protein
MEHWLPLSRGMRISIVVAAVLPTWSTWRAKADSEAADRAEKPPTIAPMTAKYSSFNRLTRVLFASVKQNLLLPFID